MKTTNPFFYPGQAYSFSLWFKSNSASQPAQTLFNTDPHAQLTVGYNYYNDSTFDIGLSNGAGWNICSTAPNGLDTFSYNTAIVTNWNHFVIAYNGSIWNYYMNKNLINNCGSGSPANVISDLYFGAISAGPQSFFSGFLDDIRIYNRAITAIEIDSLFNEIDPLTAINENHLANSILSIYPNPSHSKIQVNVSSPSTIVITNLYGQELLNQRILKEAILDVSSFENGFYFVKDLNSGNTIKFVKQ